MMGNWVSTFCVVSSLMVLTGCWDSEKKSVITTSNATGTIQSGSISSKINAEEVVDGNTQKSNSTIGISECNQFLQDYESWVNSYITLLKKFKANPKDESILEDYQAMIQQIGTWDKKAKKCTEKEILVKYIEIQERLNKEASSL